MGYTHYWRIGETAEVPPDAFGRLALDAKHLFDAATAQGYDLAGWDGEGEPELTEGAIAFNGRNPDGSYETARIEASEQGFNCCKIGFMDPASFRRYGDVLEALLIRAKTIYGAAIKVTSDGEWTGEGWGNWEKGAALYAEAFGEPAVNPMEDD